jgi:MFS family permease
MNRRWRFYPVAGGPARQREVTDPLAYPSSAVAWYTVAVLSAIYVFSFVDRQILVLLIEPVKQDLQISDTQVSLLTGASFAVLYAVMGVPMGRAADRWSRKAVIGVGVAIWSVMTIGCGFARSFWQLFVARMGVGVGEAALTPTGHAMVADLFPPHRMARGMAVFVMGNAIGGGMALVVGGAVLALIHDSPEVTVPLIGAIRSWQLVFLAVGVPSLLMLLPLATIREPRRRGSATDAEDAQSPIPIGTVLAFLWRERGAYSPMFVGGSFINLFAYGGVAWLPTLFIRVHGWPASTVGLVFGGVGSVCGVIGVFSSGWITDRLRSGGRLDAALRAQVGALAAGLPFLLVGALSPFPVLGAAALALFFMCFAAMGTLGPNAVQEVTPGPVRAQVAAMWLLVVNLIGIGLGPTSVAVVTDFVFRGEVGLGWSIALVGTLTVAAGAGIVWLGLSPFRERVARAQQEMGM